MEPREFWERNTVLAEAFCASDDRVRQAQAVLDEAQAGRSRTLAAFAVTVGDDGTVANLLGLNEREVRVARRTVGRDDARTVAEELLRAPQVPLDSFADTTVMEVHLPHPRSETVPPPPDTPPHDLTASAVLPPQSASMTPMTPMTPAAPMAPMAPAAVSPMAPAGEETVAWSSSMDSVLLWSWKSGLDLQTVAAELGLELRALLLRVQALADDGRLTSNTPSADTGRISHISPSNHPGHPGRHRRHPEDPYQAYFSPTTTAFPSPVHH
ncbi:hypothetical protein [Streptomyces sp. NPDC088400]|uniref:hypothetical protein n=1 Tax=Streptomyces sp. NPDC088400 TaxID=3365861 RepID=UPI0037FFBE38